jgi:cytochrome c peroxidase
MVFLFSYIPTISNKMKKVVIYILSLVFFIACLNMKQESFDKAALLSLDNNIDTIIGLLKNTDTLVEKDKLKALFAASRKSYKKVEPFVEYYFQGLTRRINGPALPEIKTDDNMINDPSGFQVIEEIIYSDTVDLEDLKKQTKILTTDLLFIKNTMKEMPIQEHHFYELIQHQIIRIAALGITGFDSPVSFQSIQEAAFTLDGINEWYLLYCNIKGKKVNQQLTSLFKNAIVYAQKNNNFNEFNRLEFIKNHLMPISVCFEKDFTSDLANMPDINKNKVFYGTLSNLMQGKKLNPDAFSPFSETASTNEKKELGKILFNDASLSKNNNISCASCHIASKAFTDGKVTSVTNIHNNSVQRNSPTILYAAFQKSFFYDLRSQDLENQIESVMKNPDEFDLTPKQIKKKILANPTLSNLFTKAYPTKKEITPYEIRNAIAVYVRSLMPFNSKIDEYFRGETTLSESESNGFNVFTGKAKCATCHFIPVYNGTIPPWFNNTESEVIGVPKTNIWKNAVVDEDLGRYNLNQLEPLKYSFKTPTIRNIEKTAPYMHNGVYNKLEEVVKFYELGGGNGIGMNLTYQTLPFDNLQLTPKEKNDLISFMLTLTDKKY